MPGLSGVAKNRNGIIHLGCVRGFVGLPSGSGSVIGFLTTSKQQCTIMLASGTDVATIGVNDGFT